MSPEVTTAGSTVLRSRAGRRRCARRGPACAAGAVLFGRTNMVEFAFSGVGINPHYGTPQPLAAKTRAATCPVVLPAARASVSPTHALRHSGTDTGGSVHPRLQWFGRLQTHRVPGASEWGCTAVVPARFQSVPWPIRSIAAQKGLTPCWPASLQPMPKNLRSSYGCCVRQVPWRNGRRRSRAQLVSRRCKRLRDAGVTIVEARCDALEDLFAAGNLPQTSE